MTMRIAIVQFEIAQQDTPKNLERIESFVSQAAEQKANVVVFPEDCMTGSIFGDLTKLDTTHKARTAFQELAKKYKIDIVTGSSMEGTSEGNFNTSYYVDANGNVLAQYRKNHLYPSERSFLKDGTDCPVFQTAYGKAAIVICWDLLFSELFLRLMKQGVEIIYCPSYWYKEIAESMASFNPDSEEQQIDELCVARSLETNAVMVYANAAGIVHNKNGSRDTLIGHSQIVMPVLGPIVKLNHRDEQMIVQEVDLAILEATRKIYQS